ncbi:SH3-like domain-containing protein [Labrenzia sp. EL_195]|nr:SH3-like domain-containing protein [Labrenzia sp. EL_195]
MRARSNSDSNIVAELEPFVLTSVTECAGGWCRVNGDQYDGWLDQTRLFDVYPDEVLED